MLFVQEPPVHVVGQLTNIRVFGVDGQFGRRGRYVREFRFANRNISNPSVGIRSGVDLLMIIVHTF